MNVSYLEKMKPIRLGVNPGSRLVLPGALLMAP